MNLRAKIWLRRFKRDVGNVAVLFLSTSLALMVAEIGVRLVAPQQLILIRPDIWQAVDTLGWMKRPYIKTTVNTGDGAVSLITDKRGFRIGHSPRPTGGKRILLLGDSFMEALQVEYEESLAGLLETGLRHRLQQPVEVLNTSVSGWDPPQYLLQARSFFANEHVDAVIVALYVGNDAVEVPQETISAREPQVVHDLRWPGSVSSVELIDAVFYPINDYLERRSHLFVFLKSQLRTLAMRFGLTAVYFPTEFLRSEANSQRWEVTASICADLTGLAARHGAPTVFVLIPAPFQVDTAVLHQYMKGLGIERLSVDLKQPNVLLHEELSRKGLTILDPLDVMRTAHSGGLRLYGQVDDHLNSNGHAAIARVLEPALSRLLATSRTRRSSAPSSVMH